LSGQGRRGGRFGESEGQALQQLHASAWALPRPPRQCRGPRRRTRRRPRRFRVLPVGVVTEIFRWRAREIVGGSFGPAWD
jgi:hypothetical protein